MSSHTSEILIFNAAITVLKFPQVVPINCVNLPHKELTYLLFTPERTTSRFGIILGLSLIGIVLVGLLVALCVISIVGIVLFGFSFFVGCFSQGRCWICIRGWSKGDDHLHPFW